MQPTVCSIAFCVLVFANATVYTQQVDFKKQVAPILEERCWHCHGEDEQESGLRLDQRQSMLKGGDYGLAAVVPKKPQSSYLLEVIKHLDPDMKMPPDDEKLSEKEIALIEKWIEQGAVWPGQMQLKATEKSKHWSFQPIVRAKVPTNKTAIENSNANPIDSFLYQVLQEKGLDFSEPADAHSLIRRVSIVLTGLPPTKKEIEQFILDSENDSERAYRDYVEKLLASPHFGERWAQHWLDVIRWAETNGSESNMYRKNAWTYRDYVIRSFNEDKPYNEFLLEQIAGDTMGMGEATGFLVSGPHVPAATVGQEPSAKRQARADRMDEIMQTVGASALGLSIGCARCHNHKFDPISIRDYYSMTAVFQDIEFGSRSPEFRRDHPVRQRGEELSRQIEAQRKIMRSTGPWEENWVGYKEVHFKKVKTNKVKITFLWNSSRLDELEIFATNQSTGKADFNVAAAENGGKVFIPEEMRVARAPLKNVNDGLFGTQGTSAKTEKGSKKKPWMLFTFDKPYEIERIRMSSNREDFFETDYLVNLNRFSFGPYRIEIKTSDDQWQTIAIQPNFEKLNQKHEKRVAALKEIQRLAMLYNEQGPKPSFVGRFVKPVATRVFNRGSPEDPRDEVLPAGLDELGGDLGLKENASGPDRRLQFANWLINGEHPLTARVQANRIWHHIFGRGIVSTTSDFGAAGAKPSHPELLEWLAAELMQPTTAKAKPWSVKHLIRMMVMSKAFRQSALPNERALGIDTSSELLWRFPPRRVEAETIRDSILVASGKLDRKVGGRSYRIHNVKKRYAQWEVVKNFGEATWRRMIYQERMRRVDDRMFTAFDFPDCGQVRPKRPISTTPLQALNLMNSEFVMNQAKLIAERAKTEAMENKSDPVVAAFQLILGRNPTKEELSSAKSVAESENLSLVCRALINSNEFAFLP